MKRATDVNAKPLMTPLHPKWSEFVTDLEGPNGCNFTRKKTKTKTYTWKCDSTAKRPICRRLLRRYGADVAGSLQFFAKHGGFCDCEVLFNVERGFLRSRHARTVRARAAVAAKRRKVSA